MCQHEFCEWNRVFEEESKMTFLELECDECGEIVSMEIDFENKPDFYSYTKEEKAFDELDESDEIFNEYSQSENDFDEYHEGEEMLCL